MKQMDFLLIIPALVGWISGWVVNYLADVLPSLGDFRVRPVRNCGQTIFQLRNILQFVPARIATNAAPGVLGSFK